MLSFLPFKVFPENHWKIRTKPHEINKELSNNNENFYINFKILNPVRQQSSASSYSLINALDGIYPHYFLDPFERIYSCLYHNCFTIFDPDGCIFSEYRPLSAIFSLSKGILIYFLIWKIQLTAPINLKRGWLGLNIC